MFENVDLEFGWSDGKKGSKNHFLTLEECCAILKERKSGKTARDCLKVVLKERLAIAPEYYCENPNAVLTHVKKRIAKQFKDRVPESLEIMAKYGLLRKKSS